jgi:hypothetical protein
MPKKSAPPLTDEERAKCIRETAREIEASDSKREFERAFQLVSRSADPNRPIRQNNSFLTAPLNGAGA